MKTIFASIYVKFALFGTVFVILAVLLGLIPTREQGTAMTDQLNVVWVENFSEYESPVVEIFSDFQFQVRIAGQITQGAWLTDSRVGYYYIAIPLTDDTIHVHLGHDVKIRVFQPPTGDFTGEFAIANDLEQWIPILILIAVVGLICIVIGVVEAKFPTLLGKR